MHSTAAHRGTPRGRGTYYLTPTSCICCSLRCCLDAALLREFTPSVSLCVTARDRIEPLGLVHITLRVTHVCAFRVNVIRFSLQRCLNAGVDLRFLSDAVPSLCTCVPRQL